MDLVEIRSKRAEVTLKIMELLNNFEDETDTVVEEINFERAYALGGGSLIIEVDLELTL